MSKKFLASLAVAGAAFYATSAGAVTTFVSNNSVTGAGLVVNPLVTFDEPLPTQPNGSNQTVGNFSVGGANFTGAGFVTNGSTTNLYASPAGNSTNYFAVVPNPGPGGTTSSPETITLPGSFTQFGLYWGSIDSYNVVTFSNGNSFTGSNIVNPADGNQTSPGTNIYVLFTSTVPFTTITLASIQTNAFEFDNIFWGPAQVPGPTPLPGALPLFVSGLGGLGFLRFWRKKSALKAASA